jgi:glycosyltransferase involved in cell wall biosynthesis
LHWCGQTIGEGRGLEEAVKAAGLLGTAVELHLRGHVSEGIRARLESIAGSHGANARLIFHPVVDHDELISTLDQFDVGLSLERLENPNYSRAATNKLFSYLLGGLAVAATDTMGHREIFDVVPAVGFLYPAGQPAALAEKLRAWINDPNSLRAAKQAAWDSARSRFCWDLEKEKFLSLLN